MLRISSFSLFFLGWFLAFPAASTAKEPIRVISGAASSAIAQKGLDLRGGGKENSLSQTLAPAWAAQFSGVSVFLNSVKAVNANVAWACGDKGTILRTLDGGTTWTQTSPVLSSLSCYNIEALDANTAWVIAVNNSLPASVLYKTTNGGSSWTSQQMSSDATTFYDAVRFYDSNNGILVGDPEGGYFTIYTTTNGGISWTRSASSNIPPPLSLEFGLTNSLAISGNNAWFSTVNNAFGNPRVLRSTDRGKTWFVSTSVSTSALGTQLSTIAFASDSVGIVQGINGNMIRTTTGGRTWSGTIITGATVGGSVDFSTPTSAVFLGARGQSGVSLDAGLTWSARTTPDTTTIAGISFSSSADGWAVGYRGTIWKWVGGPLPGPPWVTTSTVTNIGPTSATLRGNVTPNSAATTAQFEWGTTTALLGTPISLGAVGSGSSALPISAPLSGLSPNTTYYVRGSAQNTSGTTKGSMTSFTTLPLAGDPYEQNNTATKATKITYNFKTSGAELIPPGDVDYYQFSATSGDFVSIELVTDPNGSLDTRVSLYDAAGTEVAYSDIVSTGTERILFGIAKTQTYYIRVVDASDTASFPNGVGPTGLRKGPSHVKAPPSLQSKESVLQTGPYTLTLTLGSPAPPQFLTVGSGFDGMVPLRWIPPQSNAPSEYRIYRSTASTGPFSLVGSTVLEDFVDVTAGNGVTYFYKVTSVFPASGAESPGSNVDKATPRANGYSLTSKFAYIKPTFDGVLRQGEWLDAQVQDITIKRTLNPSSSVTMYMKNDDRTLYLALEDSNASPSTYNRLIIGIDRDQNKNWDLTAPSKEGFITVDDSAGVPIVLFYGVTRGDPYVHIEDGVRDPKGVTVKFSYGAKSLQYEIAMDLGGALSTSLSQNGIGLYIAAMSDNLNGESPPGALYLTPMTFSQVTFSKVSIARLPGEYAVDAGSLILLHMNESIGQFAVDATGNGNNGVASGTTIVDGRFGKARSFNGTTDYVGGTTAALNFGGQDFTIEGWINVLSSANQAVFSAYNNLTSATTFGLYVGGVGPGGYIDFDINNTQGVTGSNITGRKVNDGKWHHVAAVRSPGRVLLYVDGVLDGQKSVVQNPNNSNTFLIGSNGASALFKGLIDELRISNKARTPGEFNLQLPPKNLTAAAAGQQINLTWQNGGGGVALMRYRVFRGLDSTNVVQIDSIVNTSYSNSGLLAGQKYFYRVAAVDSTGFESARSSAASATTGTIAAPTLASPADGSTNQPTTVTLSWVGSAGAISYHLQVSTSNAFSPLHLDDSSLVGTSRQVTSLSNGTTYFWRVRVKTATGSSGYSPMWSFTTIGTIPAQTILSAPPDASLGVSTSPTLSWNATTGATSYRVQVSTTSDLSTTVFDSSNVAGTSMRVNGLANGTTHFWRVRATNAAGTGNWSSLWNFTTIVAAPSPPTLVSPLNTATDQPVSLTLTWNAVAGVSSYCLQLDKSNTFTSLIVNDSSITISSRAVSSLTNGTTYYWRVNAKNAGGTSAYSTIYSFTTVVAPPAAPSLSTPANNIQGLAVPVTLTWFSIAGVPSYHLQVSTNSAYSAPLVFEDTLVASSSRQVTSLAANTLYYWRVRGKNAGGYGAWSSNFTFTTATTRAVTSPGVSFPTNPSASTDYRLVSFPGTSSLSVAQILSGVQNTDWKIFRDNGAAEPNHLTELSSSSSLSPGEGYWLVTKGTFNFSNTLPMPQLNADGTYTLTVRTGWNIIGNPFDLPVSWGVVQSDNGVTAKLWSYAGTGGYQSSATLDPFKGYYVSSSSSTLKIRYPFPSSSVASSPPAVTDWKLQLALETEENRDSENFIGQAPSAKESLDGLDQPKPPRFQDQAFLALSIEAPNGGEKLLSSDFRPSAGEGQVWNFSVANPRRTSGRIRIVGIESVPPGLDVVLIDAQNTVPIDLRTKSEVVLRNSAGKSTFNLIVGKKDFVQEKKAQLIPREFELHQNYPNPFNPSTTITYKVPRESGVRLEIVSLLGQHLETLAQGIHTPGTYSVVWTADRREASGVYFARLLADGKVVMTEKMTLLK